MKIKKQIVTKASVESIPGGTAWVNVTVSQAYELCYDLRNPTSTLGNNTLDPHLALNKDWGAVSYLAISTYGGSPEGRLPEITIPTETETGSDTVSSTTGNITGVMEMDHYNEWVSCLIGETKESENRSNLIKNIDTKYVEKLPIDYYKSIEETRGMAIAEVGSSPSESYATSPCVTRSSLFGISSTISYYEYHSRTKGNDGSSDDGICFRPVIWN